MSVAAGAGMPLRDFRVHRYVNAFCRTATRRSRTGP